MVGEEKDKQIWLKLKEAFTKDDHRWCISSNEHLEDTSGYCSLTEYVRRYCGIESLGG